MVTFRTTWKKKNKKRFGDTDCNYEFFANKELTLSGLYHCSCLTQKKRDPIQFVTSFLKQGGPTHHGDLASPHCLLQKE